MKLESTQQLADRFLQNLAVQQCEMQNSQQCIQPQKQKQQPNEDLTALSSLNDVTSLQTEPVSADSAGTGQKQDNSQNFPNLSSEQPPAQAKQVSNVDCLDTFPECKKQLGEAVVSTSFQKDTVNDQPADKQNQLPPSQINTQSSNLIRCSLGPFVRYMAPFSGLEYSPFSEISLHKYEDGILPEVHSRLCLL